jgi:hypothetical protein
VVCLRINPISHALEIRINSRRKDSPFKVRSYKTGHQNALYFSGRVRLRYVDDYGSQSVPSQLFPQGRGLNMVIGSKITLVGMLSQVVKPEDTVDTGISARKYCAPCHTGNRWQGTAQCPDLTTPNPVGQMRHEPLGHEAEEKIPGNTV